jgi:hypothetical protein
MYSPDNRVDSLLKGREYVKLLGISHAMSHSREFFVVKILEIMSPCITLIPVDVLLLSYLCYANTYIYIYVS